MFGSFFGVLGDTRPKDRFEIADISLKLAERCRVQADDLLVLRSDGEFRLKFLLCGQQVSHPGTDQLGRQALGLVVGPCAIK
ncbi:hypothetical protein [Rhodovulum marinum]|uniref:hypothetical protein n=1 Tax=Rhodovulum marinum TaxID=320662 RepID=UPI001FB5DDBF|nr:hypothetical protein [Rhodovulum marinum]